MKGTKRGSQHRTLIMAMTWTLRFLVGGLFVFSGFTKGIDIWGTIYKFNEYFSALGYEVWEALNLVGVFFLCLLEFITGFCLIFGCFRKATPVIALLIMIFMLPLTLWLAVKNPVTDCGCFGDAIKLSNWQTFYKNLVITLGTLWLVFYNRKTHWLITPMLQWIAIVVSGAYLLAIGWIGYYYQPLLDFRPYKTGTALVEMDNPDSETDEEDSLLRFVYEKNGQKQEFGIDDVLPDEDDGWTFVERYYTDPEKETVSVEQPNFNTRHSKNLRLFSEDGREDLTEETIGHGRQLILMIPNLSKVSAAKTWKINSFYEWCKTNDIEMLATVGGNPYEISVWKDISLAEYPIYTSDDTSIEEVVRGNPGIVYIEDGNIKWKSSLKAIDIDDFQNESITSDPMGFARDDKRILWNLTLIFLVATSTLIFLSFSPSLLLNILKLTKYNEKANAGRMGKSQNNPDGLP